MKLYDFPSRITREGGLQIPDELYELLPADQPVRVIILVPDVDDAEEQAAWSRFTAEQFLSGYSDADSIYDRI